MPPFARTSLALSLALCAASCRSGPSRGATGSSPSPSRAAPDAPSPAPSSPLASSQTRTAPRLPLVKLADIELPGAASRFDYQEIDRARGHLVIAHMNDASVVFVDLRDGSVLKALRGIPVARGVAVADDPARVFVTSSPNTLVIIDATSMEELERVNTGKGPDGVAWDPRDKIVGVSDQHDGALSLISDAGSGTRRAIALGKATGNVAFDPRRGWFWITVVGTKPPDRLVAVDPASGEVKLRLDLPGCEGAHGLRLHPDAQSAFVACESNGVLARVALEGDHAVVTGATGADPDVLSIDSELGWLYVAAESGDLTVFDLGVRGVALVGHDRPGSNSHSVAADSATHRVFFPLMTGPNGKPVLRIMKPTGT